MIINCEVAVCIPSQSHRFCRAKVGVGHDLISESYFLVVVRANHKDRFHLIKSNVKILRASFEFSIPNRYVMLRDCNENQLVTLKLLIRQIINKQGPIPKLPSVDRIYQLKPSQTSLSSIGASKAELKKLTNKCLKTIELSSLKKIPSEIWSLKNLSILKLTQCNLKHIPRHLHLLNESLTCLVLSRNQIEEIPIWFCKRMKYLKTVDLSWNKFRRLPFEIVSLKSCKSFNFSNNSIYQLPNVFSMKIFSGTTYDKIDFSHNNLHFIHGNETRIISYNSQVHSEIDFSHNKFDQHFNLVEKLDKLLERNNPNSSLFTLALEKIIGNQRLFCKLFDDTITTKPIYNALQERIFLCHQCKKVQIKLGHYILNVDKQFPIHNFAGKFTVDLSPRDLKILYLFCNTCSADMQ